MRLVRAIVDADTRRATALLSTRPALARAHATAGATRADASRFYLAPIHRYLSKGDTALHIAAAGYRVAILGRLLSRDADVAATNRFGATPLHAAAAGVPGSAAWNPRDQVRTIERLLAAGADPDARDKRGVSPLHVAIRTRCSAAVRALLAGGADPRLANGTGTTPLQLATLTTGRGGSGSTAARAEQTAILALLGG